jgi:hypothetical protein
VPIEADENVAWSARANHSAGWRAVGGRLHLTERRLLFRPNGIERTLLFGKEWEAPRAQLRAFGVEPKGRGLFDGSLRERLRVETTTGPPQFFVVPKPSDVADRLTRELAPGA